MYLYSSYCIHCVGRQEGPDSKAASGENYHLFRKGWPTQKKGGVRCDDSSASNHRPSRPLVSTYSPPLPLFALATFTEKVIIDSSWEQTYTAHVNDRLTGLPWDMFGRMFERMFGRMLHTITALIPTFSGLSSKHFPQQSKWSFA